MLRKIVLIALTATLGFSTFVGEVLAKSRKQRDAHGATRLEQTAAEPFDLERDKLIDTCSNFTIDGSQVFQSMWENGKCFGNPKLTRVVAQVFPFRALCFRRSLNCFDWSEIEKDARLRRLYDEMTSALVPLSDAKVCTTRNHRWARWLVTKGEAPCAPSYNDAYEIDFDASKGCVYLGSNMLVGCVTLTPQEYEVAWREHGQVVARLEQEKLGKQRLEGQSASKPRTRSARRVAAR